MSSTTVEIIGMHCMGCVRTVTNALKRIIGVKDAEVSLQANSAIVQFDEKETTIEELRKAIVEAGYDVSK